MQKLHNYMAQQIAEAGGKIEKFYYCPHLPGGAVTEFAVECDCRKPKPGLILRALEEYDIDKDTAFFKSATSRAMWNPRKRQALKDTCLKAAVYLILLKR